MWERISEANIAMEERGFLNWLEVQSKELKLTKTKNQLPDSQAL